MKKRKYYKLLEEYRNIIVQMKFNQDFCNRNRLNEIVEELENEIRNALEKIRQRSRLIIRRCSIYSYNYEELYYLQNKELKLVKLLIKIKNKEYIENVEYENTYFKMRTYFFGFIPVSFVFSLIILIILMYGIIKIF